MKASALGVVISNSSNPSGLEGIGIVTAEGIVGAGVCDGLVRD